MTELTYSDYLELDTLLSIQTPRVPGGAGPAVTLSEHFFIVVHQSCELWLKQVICDIGAAGLALDPSRGEVDAELGAELLGRVSEMLRILLSQLVVVEKLPVRHFAEFRPYLGTASGADSDQFKVLDGLLADDGHGGVLFAAYKAAVVHDGMSLAEVCRRGPGAGVHHRIAEELMDIADRYWSWKVTHLTTIAKLLGDLPGTAGTSGLEYLAGRVVLPFGELRQLRGDLHAELSAHPTG